MALFTNKDTQAGQPKNISVGQVLGISVSGTMSGYVDGASLSIGAPPGGGVQAVGTIKVTAGAITGFTITNPGAGYTSAPIVTAPAGTGAVLVASVAKNAYKNDEIVFVSYEESQIPANRIKGLTSPGWYHVQEKLKSDGQVTYKVENLVAMTVLTATATDAKSDDLVVGDVDIVITAQPGNRAITGAGATTFVTTATGASTYQWQVQTGGAGAYANVTNGGVYSTATTATLNISSVTGLSGNRYRCVVGNGGTAQVTTRGATLTVTA